MTTYLLLFPFALAWLVTLQGVPWVMQLGQRHQWVDQPDHRKVHRTPIVRVGGLGMAAGLLLATLVLGGMGWIHSDFRLTGADWAIVLGGLGFFAIGFADDIWQLPPLPRLVMQVLVALGVWGLGVQVEYLPVPLFGAVSVGWLSLPITILWIAGTANALNWFDGLDGLAGGVGGLCALMLAITAMLQGQWVTAAMALTLSGAALGFLRYNFPPAKIFMGDGGSYLIGFTLAALCAHGLMGTPRLMGAIAPFFILGIPLLDMTLVMIARISNGKSPLYPDRRHLHHRLLARGCSPLMTTGYIWALSVWTGSWSLVITRPSLGWLCLGATSLVLGAMTLFLLRISRKDKLQTSYSA
ncbi:glycosyltransferase family 4 protein [Lyngbya confervoides]|uniref:Undecaprenyl/decaprenyl-phosphate alpha-N-acetylglucosaminyl 1-phosphate transferase n=1 Tax=Lyngbya confervoides BDU141951 TaxID=1574623 RepID=A0ABD4SYW8_9CYAN|nr:MraY family glycosyltransferase [Lyngbya confervoides]MCM1981594.1 undecaprenyl/decaprenyl-phosphate alpha-N-acetylglucosaminyl 1-phosphate transferase [Lyngbya confervoides BDU141951]